MEIPGLKAKLDPYQIEAVKFHLCSPYSINGYDMGLGKSVMSIATNIASEAKNVLVVMPKSLLFNWKDEIEKFVDCDVNFSRVTYGSLHKVGSAFADYDSVICDEAHYLKNLEAKRTINFHNMLLEHKPKRFMALTGTPVKNHIGEFYSLLRLCYYGGHYPEFAQYAHSIHYFLNKFSNRVQKKIPGTSRTVLKYEGLKNVALLKELLAPIYTRKLAKDVLDLPPERDREIVIKDESEVDKFLQDAWESYSGEKKDKTFSSGKAVSALAKTAYTIDFVKDSIDSMGKVIIFTDHVQAAEKLGDSLGVSPITGDTSSSRRDQAVKDINEGKTKYLVATIKSLSEGVNLTQVNHMIFNDDPWVPADALQARRRIRRRGQKKTCFYYYILASRYDQVIHRTLAKKRKIIEELDK